MILHKYTHTHTLLVNEEVNKKKNGEKKYSSEKALMTRGALKKE